MLKIFIIIILIVPLFLQAQTSYPQTSDIRFDVNTESLELTNKPQELAITIDKLNQEKPGSIKIDFEKIESVFTLISARLNGEELWLIKTNTSATNPKVLAWNFDKTDLKLVLYPSNWASPYSIELLIQVNIKNSSSMKDIESDIVNLKCELASGTFEALPSGNGNEIQIK